MRKDASASSASSARPARPTVVAYAFPAGTLPAGIFTTSGKPWEALLAENDEWERKVTEAQDQVMRTWQGVGARLQADQS